MNARLKNIAQKIDARTVRERGILFFVVSAVLVAIAHFLYFDAQFKRQKDAEQLIATNQVQTAAARAEIQSRMVAQSADPDIANRARLLALRKEITSVKHQLEGVQQGLVAPEKMATLLEDLLKRNSKLRLVALKTLPVEPLLAQARVEKKVLGTPAPNAAATKDAQPAKPAVPPAGLTQNVFKHGVQLTVQGNYLDMLAYLNALEKMPWQLFWGRAQFDTHDDAKATLTLTLFTLSLDETWLNI